MPDRRTRVSQLIDEARQDLAYRPRIHYGAARTLRPAVPIIAVLVVAMLTAGAVIVSQLPQDDPLETTALRRPVARQTLQGAHQDRAVVVEPPKAAPPPVAPLTSIRKPHLFVVADKPLGASGG